MEARRQLDVRSGDPFVSGKAFRDKLDKWHKVVSHDGLSLQKFAGYLSQCKTEMVTISNLNARMMSRAIHLKTANSLETDSFSNALRRFIATRGPVRRLSCDIGTDL